MLTGIGLRNFKAFGDELQEAPLSKITLIYGPNSGGKSSIIQALLLLKQSLRNSYPYRERLLVPRGEYTDLGSFQSLMHRHDLKRELSISLKYKIGASDNRVQNDVSMTFNRVSELSGVRYVITSFDSLLPLLVADSRSTDSNINPFGLSQWLFKVMEDDRIIEGIDLNKPPRFLHYFALPPLSRAQESALRKEEELYLKEEEALARVQEIWKREEEFEQEEEAELEQGLDWETGEDELGLEEEVPVRILNRTPEEEDREFEEEEARVREEARIREEELEEEEERELELANELAANRMRVQELNGLLLAAMENHALTPEDIPDYFEHHLRSVHYLGPLRSAPERLYRLSSEKDDSTSITGIQGESSANVLYRNARFRREVDHWFDKDKFDIPYDLNVIPLGETSLAGEHVTIALTDKRTNTQVTLADVGYGINQLLPVIIEGIASQEGSIICVEQPEIHLHPRLQANIADLMIDSIDDVPGKQKQWIVETHSELLILRLQRRIREGKIKPEDISVLYVDPNDESTEGSAIIPLRMDENGDFIDHWPEGFFDEAFNELTAEPDDASRLVVNPAKNGGTAASIQSEEPIVE